MPESFRERVDTASAIKGILDSYPFGNGLLRELLQNSDDAKATTQIFTLDCRQHRTSFLLDPVLSGSQGPALLCENDSVFRDSDWTALRTIHGSNKKADETKIGKYGLGFRSCYHVTDNPHILSSNKLVVFDPHEEFATPGGVAINIAEEAQKYEDQLEAFGPSVTDPASFSGTVIRLPLRTPQQANNSRIRKTSFSIEDIQTLFNDFIDKELKVTMLFLQNIHAIKLRLIDVDGTETTLAKVYIEDSHLIAQKRVMKRDSKTHFETFRCVVRSSVHDHEDALAWRICHLVLSDEETARIMSDRLGNQVEQRLVDDKLFSHIALAFPLLQAIENGRLFTLLPLPIFTEFPLHLHAILALTPDRQALRNRQETGLSSESRERLLVEWNLTVFETFAPRAWARLLDILITEGEVGDVWKAWPSVQKTANQYWQKLPASVAEEVVREGLAVFPRVQPPDAAPSFVPFQGSFVAPTDFLDDVLQVLTKTGLVIIQPPTAMFAYDIADEQMLNPRNIHRVLQTSLVDCLTLEERMILLDYLLDSNSITDIPLIPTVDGHFVALSMSALTTQSYKIATPDVVKLFGHLDPTMIPASSLSVKSRSVFCSASCPFNVTQLTVSDLRRLLILQMAASTFADTVTPSLLSWLSQFWAWIDNYRLWLQGSPEGELLDALEGLPILPATTGLLRSVQSGYLCAARLDIKTCSILQSLGVPFLDTSIPDAFLRSQGIARDAFSLSYVLDSLDMREVEQLTDSERPVLQTYFAASQHLLQQTLSSTQMGRLKRLPVFSTLAPGVLPPASSISSLSTAEIVYIKDSRCPLPVIKDTTFVDVSDHEAFRHVALLIDPFAIKNGLDEVDILRRAIGVLSKQTVENMDLLMSRIVRRMMDLGQASIDQMKTVPFVVTDNMTRRAPTDVVDPHSEVAPLYEGEAGWLPAGAYASEFFVPLQPHFRQRLTADIVRERIQFLSARVACCMEEDRRKAQALLKLLDSQPSAALFDPVIAIAPWLPTADGRFCNSAECRSALTREEELLFDLALPSVAVKVKSPMLRRALTWHQPPRFEVVLEQMQLSVKLNQTDQVGASTRLRALIIHLAIQYQSSVLNEEHRGKVTSLVGEKPWIPVDEQTCVATRHAILSTSRSFRIRGSFKRVRAGFFSHDYNVYPLLKALGCEDLPSLSALVHEVSQMVKSPSTTKDDIVALLEQCAARLSATDPCSDLSMLMVPVVALRHGSMTGVAFEPLGSSYYNDLRLQASFSFPRRPFSCHPCVSGDLAQQLKIPFASELRLEEDEDDDDIDDIEMGEDFTSRIAGVLRDYDIAYAINEFIANAVDAGATRFSICVDERTFGESKILSPELARFQGPALILYNNALFKQKDFEGIRKVGTGGKIDEPDTIGKFGLGALSMFHFTDLPCIVSGDRVMFLDPSGKLLPRKKGRHRTALYRSVSSLTSKFADQMAPFESLHEFSSARDRFKGTLFRLPLRQQPSRLSENLPSITDIVQRLRASYLRLASSSMLFTDLEHVEAHWIHTPSAFIRAPTKPLWRVSKSVTTDEPAPSSIIDGATATSQSVLLLRTTTWEKQYEDKWFTCQMMWPVASVPSDHAIVLGRYKISSSTVGLRFALAFPLQAGITRIKEKLHLFSTLMLPVTTSLPAHINAPFALSSDRRTIRYDPPDPAGTRIPEARFNHWILVKTIPALYQYALSRIRSKIAHPEDLWAHWPQSGVDEVSRSVVDGFFESLMSTPHPICTTTQGGRVKPSDAFLSYASHPPSLVRTALNALEDSGMIRPPSSFITSRMNGCGTALATAEFIRRILSEQHNALHNWLLSLPKEEPAQHVSSILSYLLDAEGVTLAGLPLLILRNNSFADFPQTNQTIYYIHHHNISDIFPENRFLASCYDNGILTRLLERGIAGIARLDGDATVSFIRGKLGTSSRTSVSLELAKWIRSVWRALYDDQRLPDFTKCSAFEILPLFQTHAGEFISLEYAKVHALLPPQFALRTWEDIVNAIERLDILILANREENRCLSQESLSLSVLVNKLSSTGRTLSDLSAADHETLASWIRQEMSTALRDAVGNYDRRRQYRQLPVWRATRGGESVLASADDVVVLPRDVHVESLQPYLVAHVTFAEYSHDLMAQEFTETTRVQTGFGRKKRYRWISTEHPLKHMGAQNISQYLQLPAVQVLSQADVSSYKEFLVALLVAPSLQHAVLSTVMVPNGDLRLHLVTGLYDEEVSLFSHCLRARPHLFVHPLFRDQKTLLRAGGLQHTITTRAFEACANALHDDVVADPHPDQFIAAANLAFAFYKHNLAFVASGHLGSLPGNLSSCLTRLRTLRFIPRLHSRRRTAFWEGSNYSIRDFPLIVAPEDVVLEKDAAVCWSQYTLCDEQDVSDILRNHKGAFASVSIHSVVEHLRVLALQVAIEYSGDAALLSDITATYRWLDDQEDANSNTVSELLQQYKDEALFLNVDDPLSEPWCFVPASSLVFNLHFDENGLYTVREFLSSRRKLLRLAGGSSLASLQYSRTVTSAVTDSVVRSRFDEKRMSGELCDVVLIPTESDLSLTEFKDRLRAHRIFLSVMVPHFGEAFKAEMAESLTGEYQFHGTFFGAQAFLDFVYTGDIVVPPLQTGEEMSELLGELLDLLELADMWNVPDMKSYIGLLIDRHQLLTPDTLTRIDEVAKKYNALDLAEYCEYFKRENSDILARLKVAEDTEA